MTELVAAQARAETLEDERDTAAEARDEAEARAEEAEQQLADAEEAAAAVEEETAAAEDPTEAASEPEEASPPAAAESEEAQAAPAGTPQEQATALATSALAGAEVRSVDVSPSDDGAGLLVDVIYLAGDSFTDNMIRRGIESTMVDVYTTLYTSELPVQSVSVTAVFPLVDNFGNEEEGTLYQTLLTDEVAAQVNFDNEFSIDWPNVWDTLFQHPSIQES